MFKLSRTLTALALLVGLAESFAPAALTGAHRPTALCATSDRRAFLAGGAAALSWLGIADAAVAEQAKEYRQEIEVNAFNGLAFNYRGTDNNGLDSATLNEPSVSYAEFNQRLKSGEVEFVEFMAPDGDAAYATFKAKEGQEKGSPIRIGEGYPTEQHDGFSSPMFCVRTVKNAGVPYKFTVPALAKINKKDF
jgi:hypothetical protein